MTRAKDFETVRRAFELGNRSFLAGNEALDRIEVMFYYNEALAGEYEAAGERIAELEARNAKLEYMDRQTFIEALEERDVRIAELEADLRSARLNFTTSQMASIEEIEDERDRWKSRAVAEATAYGQVCDQRDELERALDDSTKAHQADCLVRIADLLRDRARLTEALLEELGDEVE